MIYLESKNNTMKCGCGEVLDFLSNIVATTIEGIGIFVLTLNLFRFRAKDYTAVIISTNIIVSIMNYVMQHYNLYYDYTAVVNLVIMILVFIFLLKVSIIDALTMSLVGFVMSFIIQGIIVLLFTLFNKVSLAELRIEDAKYYLQILSGIIYIALSWYLNKKHWWFTFIPFKRSFKIKLSRLNLSFIASFLAVVAILGVYVHMNEAFLYIVIMLLMIFSAVLYFTIKREKEA
jgi:hypothetical protein